MLVTGLGYAMWCWQPQLPAFAERRRVIALDNRGTGRSPKPPGPYSIAGMADDVVAVMDRFGIGSSAVLGHSMGGYIAQELALRHPSRVRSLVLVGTSAGGEGAVPVPRETLDIWLAYAHLPPPEYVRATMWLSFSQDWPEEHPTEYEALMEARLEHPTPPEAWRAQFEAATAWTEAGRPAEEIGVPTLVVHGDADRVVPVDNGRSLAARIPHALLRELPGRGHNLHLEIPEEFNELVLEFLA